MTPLQIIAEWKRGCSCASYNKPEECAECTRAMVDALEKTLTRWRIDNDAPNAIHPYEDGIMLEGDADLDIYLGGQAISLVKEFGPTIFAPIRIRPVVDGKRCAWVIEREDRNGDLHEWAQVPAQLDEDFEGEPMIHADCGESMTKEIRTVRHPGQTIEAPIRFEFRAECEVHRCLTYDEQDQIRAKVVAALKTALAEVTG